MKERPIEELARECLAKGLIDQWKMGRRILVQIGDATFDLKPKVARKVLAAILRELGGQGGGRVPPP